MKDQLLKIKLLKLAPYVTIRLKRGKSHPFLLYWVSQTKRKIQIGKVVIQTSISFHHHIKSGTQKKKRIIDLSMKNKTIKFLRENVGKKIFVTLGSVTKIS